MENDKLPIPRKGLFGLWDRFIGPGATLAENALILVSSVTGAIAAALRIELLEFDFLQLVAAAVMGFDLIGGAICNATNTTKRWYHRPEVGWVQHMGFILLHLVYVAIAAWLFRDQTGFDWTYFGSIGSSLCVAATIVLAVPYYLKRPVAAGLYLVAIAIGLYGVGLTSGIEWFVPVLFLKLLIGHLVPEELPNRSSTYQS